MNSEADIESGTDDRSSSDTPSSLVTPSSVQQVMPLLEESVWSDESWSWDGEDIGDLSGEDTANTNAPLPPDQQRCVRVSNMFKAWVALRWRLSRRVFSVPLPLFTVGLDLKLGDLVITLPLLLLLLAVSAVQLHERDVKGSSTPPTLMLILVFGFAVRNNSVVLLATGIPFERALFYHKIFAFATIVFTSMHALAYVLSRNQGEQPPENAKVASGMIAFIAMGVLYLLSQHFIRQQLYTFFVRAHWVLFIVVIISAVLHGASIALIGILPWEIDMVFRVVYRSRVYAQGSFAARKEAAVDSYTDGPGVDVPEPRRRPRGVAARSQMSIYQLPDNITCIQFPRIRDDTGEEFEYKAGQYAFLCVPKLSALEWHPFSISSSPHEDLVTFHIKAVGDWTMRLLQAAPEERVEAEAPFEVLIDGPYGSLAIDIANAAVYSHFVFFAGGIGVTPLRSIVNWLYNECYVRRSQAVQRMRFIWCVSDCETIEALVHRDSETLKDDGAAYLPDVLLCPTTLNHRTETFVSEIYLTRGLIGTSVELDPQLAKCLWLRCRPDVEEILREVGEQALQNGKSRVAVLASGPCSLMVDVVTTSSRLSREMSLHFDVHSERFEF